jgi:non-ribosomal peptide synthetase component F
MAVIISGAGYVPLSSTHPTSRQQQIITDCQASIVVCSPEYRLQFAGVIKKVVAIDEASVLNLPATQRDQVLRAGPSDPCYVIYT